MFYIRLLGTVRVERDGEAVGGFRRRQALPLLCYLASRGEPLSRTHLIDLFWPGEGEVEGRASLSRALNGLSGLLPGCIQADRRTVQFYQSSAVWTDITAFGRLVAEASPGSRAAAADLYRGDFLADIFVDGCPDFDYWLLRERELWRQRVTQVLQDSIVHYTEGGEYRQALGPATRLLDLEPWLEEAHRHMMRLLALTGQRSRALAQYGACRRILADELGVEPAAETRAVYEDIRVGQGGLEAETGKVLQAQPRAERRQLTVLAGKLAGFPGLADRLDPEELEGVVQAQRHACLEVIARYRGYAAQHRPGEMVVYFGYPRAAEDDLRRAVEAGLGIVGAVAELSRRLEKSKGIALRMQVGIHAGLVVIRDLPERGGSGAPEVVGLAPILAACLQNEAGLDTVAVSEACYRQARRWFDFEPLGACDFCTRLGRSERVQVYRVRGGLPA